MNRLMLHRRLQHLPPSFTISNDNPLSSSVNHIIGKEKYSSGETLGLIELGWELAVAALWLVGTSDDTLEESNAIQRHSVVSMKAVIVLKFRKEARREMIHDTIQYTMILFLAL